MSSVKQNLNEIFDTADIEDVVCYDDKQIEQSFYQTDQKQLPNSTALVEQQQTSLSTTSQQDTGEMYKQEDDQIKHNIDDDYNHARENLRSLLYDGEDLLELAIRAARDTENPKSIESAVKLMGQLADINTRLLELTAKKQEVFNKTRPKTPFNASGDSVALEQGSVINNVTNNTMFVGTPADLAEMLKKAKSEVQPTIDLQNEQTNS